MHRFRIALFGLSLFLFMAAVGYAGRQWVDQLAWWQPRIHCRMEAVDLGHVSNRENQLCTFTIENHGDENLIIESVEPGCGGCVEILRYPTKPLPPRAKGSILASLKTSGVEGLVVKNVNVRSNDPKHPTLILKIRATLHDGQTAPIRPEITRAM